jgi:Na+/melibiose symporter-like transporter
MSLAPLSPSVRVGYSLGSVATESFATVPGLLLLPYLTDPLGIAAVLAGAIMLLPKALDVLLNPVAGRISDRHQSPLGPRRPFLLRGGLSLAVCFALLFAARAPRRRSPAAPRSAADRIPRPADETRLTLEAGNCCMLSLTTLPAHL